MQEKIKRPYHKLSDINGSYLRQVYRFLGGQVAFFLKNSRITPNMISIVSFLLVIISLPFFYFANFPSNLIAAIFLFMSMVLDKADGSLARLKGKGTPFGSWLDSTTDYLGIFLIFVVISARENFLNSNAYAWMYAFLGYAGYNLSKLAFIIFKKYFGADADRVIEREKGQHPLRGSFHVNELFVNNAILVFSIFGWFNELLIFLSVYCVLFFLASFLMFSFHAYKKNRVYNQKELLHSKF